METIEQIAIDFTLAFGETNDVNVLSKANCYELGLRRGVKFAQRWIPISEELPIDKQEIIAKNDVYKETFIFFENGVGDSEYIKRYFTHWRPIELN